MTSSSTLLLRYGGKAEWLTPADVTIRLCLFQSTSKSRSVLCASNTHGVPYINYWEWDHASSNSRSADMPMQTDRIFYFKASSFHLAYRPLDFPWNVGKFDNCRTYGFAIFLVQSISCRFWLEILNYERSKIQWSPQYFTPDLEPCVTHVRHGLYEPVGHLLNLGVMCQYTHTPCPEKRCHFIFACNSRNANRFSKFFYHHTLQ